MKTIQSLKLTILLSTAIITTVNAQDQKKISIYLEMDKNGKSVIVDTTFSNQSEMQAYLKSKGIDMIDIPKPPNPPAVPMAPNEPAPPIAPNPPEAPNSSKMIIRLDDIDLSEEDKASMEKEMEQLKIEIKDRNIEIEKAVKEIKKMNHDFENPEDVHQKIIIRELSNDSNDKDKKVMIIRSGEINENKPKVIKIEIYTDGENKYGVAEVKSEKVLANVEASQTKNQLSEENYKLDASEFKIYPNPTTGNITVSFKSKSEIPVVVKLMDAAGRELVNEEVQMSNGFFSKDYNIEGQAKGTYLLQLRQGDQWRHEKIVMR